MAIFSDGIPEAENAAGEEFGEGRLAALLTDAAGKPLEGIIQAGRNHSDGYRRRKQMDARPGVARRHHHRAGAAQLTHSDSGSLLNGEERFALPCRGHILDSYAKGPGNSCRQPSRC